MITVVNLQEIEAEAAAWLEEGAHATDDIGNLATSGGGTKCCCAYCRYKIMVFLLPERRSCWPWPFLQGMVSLKVIQYYNIYNRIRSTVIHIELTI